MNETEHEVAERIKGEHEGETEHEIGKRIDSFFGFGPRTLAAPQPVPEAPKPFPARALRDGPGEAPMVEAFR